MPRTNLSNRFPHTPSHPFNVSDANAAFQLVSNEQEHWWSTPPALPALQSGSKSKQGSLPVEQQRPKLEMQRKAWANNGNETVGYMEGTGEFSCLTDGQCSKNPAFMATCMGCDRVLRVPYRFG